MGLLDDLEVDGRVYPCKVRTVAETLEPADRQILLDAISNPDWAILGLVSALGKRGLKFAPSVLKKHREKMCSCWKI